MVTLTIVDKLYCVEGDCRVVSLGSIAVHFNGQNVNKES